MRYYFCHALVFSIWIYCQGVELHVLIHQVFFLEHLLCILNFQIRKNSHLWDSWSNKIKTYISAYKVVLKMYWLKEEGKNNSNVLEDRENHLIENKIVMSTLRNENNSYQCRGSGIFPSFRKEEWMWMFPVQCSVML